MTGRHIGILMSSLKGSYMIAASDGRMRSLASYRSILRRRSMSQLELDTFWLPTNMWLNVIVILGARFRIWKKLVHHGLIESEMCQMLA